MITKLNIPCVWGGDLAGILLKSHTGIASLKKPTQKFIGIHGWLDNLNSLLPLAAKLIDRHPNYEIYLYDRVGHGLSSHLPKGTDYSYGCYLRDLRTVTDTLGWNKEKYSFIGHSYGAHLAVAYAAAYPEEISCLVALDSLIGNEHPPHLFWENVATRIDNNLKYHRGSLKKHIGELTYEKAIELIKRSRDGLDDKSAKLLLERSIQRDKDNKLYFTRDAALKNLQLIPFSQDMSEEAVKRVQASILFIGVTKPQWPTSKRLFQLLEQHNSKFEMTILNGSHHFHMTHVDSVLHRIEQYFDKYLK